MAGRRNDVLRGLLRQRDGGTTTIELELDGQLAVAYFPAMARMQPATLTQGSQIVELAVSPPGSRPEGLLYFCRP